MQRISQAKALQSALRTFIANASGKAAPAAHVLNFVAAAFVGQQYNALAALLSRDDGDAGTGALAVWYSRLSAWLTQPSAPVVRFSSAPVDVGAFLEVTQTPLCQLRDALVSGSSSEPACAAVRHLL